MANYRKKANRDARNGCGMCKPWKKHNYKLRERQKFNVYRRIVGTQQELDDS